MLSGYRWTKGWACDGRTYNNDPYYIFCIGNDRRQGCTAGSDGDHRRYSGKEENMQKAKTKRVPTRVHSRKIDRNVARTQMKKAGVHRPNKRIADNWRLYSEQ